MRKLLRRLTLTLTLTLPLTRRLSERHPTAIVSGRSVEKLIQWVNVRGLYFAGSHGFEITG